jgi:hypothetical protein
MKARIHQILLDLVSITVKNGTTFRKEGLSVSVHGSLSLARHATQPGPARRYRQTNMYVAPSGDTFESPLSGSSTALGMARTF